MARRTSRSSLVHALIGDAPVAPAVAVCAMLAAMAVLAVLPLAGVVEDALLAGHPAQLAAILLAFLAGVRFARGLAGEPALVIGAAAISLAAFGALLLPAGLGLLVLAFLHAAQGMWDVWSADGVRVPAWYAGFRARTAPAAVAILVVAYFAAS